MKRPKIEIPEGLVCFCGGDLGAEHLGDRDTIHMRLFCVECGHRFPDMSTAEGAINFARGEIKRKEQ